MIVLFYVIFIMIQKLYMSSEDKGWFIILVNTTIYVCTIAHLNSTLKTKQTRLKLYYTLTNDHSIVTIREI